MGEILSARSIGWNLFDGSPSQNERIRLSYLIDQLLLGRLRIYLGLKRSLFLSCLIFYFYEEDKSDDAHVTES